MVLIPQPGKDLTLTRNWRPLNVINCMGKLAEKVVADQVQEYGSRVFHDGQYGLVQGRSAMDVLYSAVRSTRKYLFVRGAVG